MHGVVGNYGCYPPSTLDVSVPLAGRQLRVDKDREINALKREQLKATLEMRKVVATNEKQQVGACEGARPPLPVAVTFYLERGDCNDGAGGLAGGIEAQGGTPPVAAAAGERAGRPLCVCCSKAGGARRGAVEEAAGLPCPESRVGGYSCHHSRERCSRWCHWAGEPDWGSEPSNATSSRRGFASSACRRRSRSYQDRSSICAAASRPWSATAITRYTHGSVHQPFFLKRRRRELEFLLLLPLAC